MTLVGLSWIGTGVFAASACTATVLAAARPANAAVAMTLFAAGTVAFVLAYATAVSRSRDELIGMGGLFFLAGSAPAAVRRHLLGSFAIEVVVAITTASVGIATSSAEATNPLAFGVLAPMYGLGLAGLWGARHGAFPPRGGRPGP